MEQRYKALRIIATIYKIIGTIIAAAAVLAGLGFCVLSAIGSLATPQAFRDSGLPAVSGILAGIIFALAAILVGGVYAVLIYGAGDIISLLIALEENTRVTSSLLKQAFTGPTLPAPTTAITPTPTTTLPSK